MTSTGTSSCNSKKRHGVWVIGEMSNQLPSSRQTLSLFFYLHVKEKTIQVSATQNVKEVIFFWNKARIPTRKDCHVISKIKNQYERW